MLSRPRIALLVALGALLAALAALLPLSRSAFEDSDAAGLPAVSAPAAKAVPDELEPAIHPEDARHVPAIDPPSNRGRGDGPLDGTPQASAPSDSSDPTDSAGASSPEDAAFTAAFGEPTPELLRASVEAVVADVFADRRLSRCGADGAAARHHFRVCRSR